MSERGITPAEASPREAETELRGTRATRRNRWLALALTAWFVLLFGFVVVYLVYLK